jgi:hypothetical protein
MAGQAPFLPQDFAMGKRPQASGGFSEQNIPSANVGPTFSEQDLPNPQIMDFVKGTTETASDEAMAEAPKHLKTPEAIQGLLLKGKADAGDEGGFTDSLTASEKVALGLLAIMPLIGGAIGGGEDGALLGAGAAGQGLATFGKVKFQDQQQAAKDQALKNKIIREDEKFGRAETGRDKRAGIRAAATTKAQKMALDKEDRVRQQALTKDWRKDDVRKAYDAVRASDGKLQAALKGDTGIDNLVSIIAFHKGLDPGSVVRDSEVVMVQRAQGIKGRMENMLGAAEGKTLSRAAKAQMSKLSKEFVAIHAELARSRANDFRTEAESFGLNPDFVVPPEFFKTIPSGKPVDPGPGQEVEPDKGPGKKGVSRLRRQRDASGNLIPRQ